MSTGPKLAYLFSKLFTDALEGIRSCTRVGVFGVVVVAGIRYQFDFEYLATGYSTRLPPLVLPPPPQPPSTTSSFH